MYLRIKRIIKLVEGIIIYYILNNNEFVLLLGYYSLEKIVNCWQKLTLDKNVISKPDLVKRIFIMRLLNTLLLRTSFIIKYFVWHFKYPEIPTHLLVSDFCARYYKLIVVTHYTYFNLLDFTCSPRDIQFYIYLAGSVNFYCIKFIHLQIVINRF